jgi:hypothetical protein
MNGPKEHFKLAKIILNIAYQQLDFIHPNLCLRRSQKKNQKKSEENLSLKKMCG